MRSFALVALFGAVSALDTSNYSNVIVNDSLPLTAPFGGQTFDAGVLNSATAWAATGGGADSDIEIGFAWEHVPSATLSEQLRASGKFVVAFSGAEDATGAELNVFSYTDVTPTFRVYNYDYAVNDILTAAQTSDAYLAGTLEIPEASRYSWAYNNDVFATTSQTNPPSNVWKISSTKSKLDADGNLTVYQERTLAPEDVVSDIWIDFTYDLGAVKINFADKLEWWSPEEAEEEPTEEPAEGGDDTPAEGGDDTPAEGGDDTPAEGGDDTPVEGGDDTPAEGGDGEEPAEGGDGEEPAEGGDGEEPAEGGDGEEPAEGGDGEEPAEGGDGEEPAEDGDGEEPAEDGDGEEPAEETNPEEPADESEDEDATPETEEPKCRKREAASSLTAFAAAAIAAAVSLSF